MENIKTRSYYAGLKTFEAIKLFLQEKGLLLRKSAEHREGTKLATLDQEGKVKVWDARTGDLLVTASGTYLDEKNQPSLQFSESGNSLVITDQEFVTILYFAPEEVSNPPVEVKLPRKRI